MHKIFYALLVLLLIGCNEKKEGVSQYFKKYDETTEVEDQQKHENNRMKFKLIQSKILDMNAVFLPFQKELSQFSEADYLNLKPLILEKSIPLIQTAIKEGKLSYERLTLFYLYRIKKFESDSTKYLNAIISLNPNVIEEAKQKDKELKSKSISNESIFGMPILLKDNINTNNMPTTAGAIVLANNRKTEDAFIVKKLKENGALILGKVNLSEWAYFFCSDCPLGYSAVGGQTLNPYGRKVFETGGSSAGSGVATAANYAIAAVGTETSGSITSPSSQNSVVGLKPTIGVLRRTGIVPISSTLDTPGPMTKNVIDNAIMLQNMYAPDINDNSSVSIKAPIYLIEDTPELDITISLKDFRLGILKPLLTDSIYASAIEKMRKVGAEIVEIKPPKVDFNGFLTLLNIDMKHDLPKYLNNNADKSMFIKNVKDVVEFNKKDSLLRAPYGQQLFEGIIRDSTTLDQLEVIKGKLNTEGKYFLQALKDEDLDVILSINNYHSGIAAVANHPTLTVPMGYKASGEPISLTFIGKPFSERVLLEIGYAFEQLTEVRKMPKNYQ